MKKFFNRLMVLLRLRKKEEHSFKKISMDKLDSFFDQERAGFSDSTLIRNYYIIKSQVERGHRSDEVLIKYINELEYRGIKYE